MELFEAIKFYLFKERMLNVGVFDAFFDREAIEKRKQQEVPTEQEELARQGRQNAIAMLTDFSLAWPKAEILEVAPGVYATGVLDESPTANDLKAYKEAQQRKDAITLSGNGWTLTFDGNTVTIRTSNGIVQFSLQQYEELRAAIANVSTITPLNDAYGYANGSQVVTSSNITPGVKSQNEKAAAYHIMSQNELAARHFKSQNELAAEQSLATKQNEERRQYSMKQQYATGKWGSRKGDG